jgi:hypothetical protein
MRTLRKLMVYVSEWEFWVVGLLILVPKSAKPTSRRLRDVSARSM